MESAFVKFAISVFVLFLQTKQGLYKNGEKVEAQCFCKDICIIFTDKTRVR